MAIVLGLNAKLYRNTGTFSTPVWNEIDIARDVTLTLESSEADVSSRVSQWRATAAALKDASIEFQMVWDQAHADLVAVKDAWVNNTDLELLVLDGSSATTGNSGLRAICRIFSFTRNEALEEALTVDVVAKPSYAAAAQVPTWYTVP
jgi:hypothetical protein